MGKTIIIGALIILWLFVTLPASADVIGIARLSLIQGDVVVQTSDTGAEWVAATINMPLLPGDKIWVPERGRAEIQFLGRTYLRADSNTDVDITKLKRDSESNIYQVAVPQGRTYINYRGSSVMDSVFQVDTPLASVMAYKPSKFEVNVYENGYSEVSVIDGVVYVEGQYGNTRVEEGHVISIGAENYAELSPLRPRDEWIRWNLSRDSAFARVRESSRYLPPDLDVYSSDFDEHGRWFHTPDYGYVWRPTMVISGWAPYRTGRWVWMHGDYVWISYEPWGWVPYHYGRWGFRIGIGWFWVPPAINAVFWAPGFVAWIHTPTYISWVPLAPGEIYYGHGHYGPHSVNLTKVNIKNISVTNVYVNSNVRNAVTVIHRDTFLTGKHVKVVNVPANPFVAGIKVSPGRPEIKPVKATSLPMPTKIVNQKVLPSKRITEIAKTTGISNRHIAVKEHVSVFKTGKPVDPMQVHKVVKPKPVTEIQKLEIKKPQVQKGIIEKPDVMPREGVGKPPVQKKEVSKPKVQKGIIEKPAVKPREDVGKPPVQKKGISKPEAQKKVLEKSKIMTGEGVGKQPLQQRGVGKPQVQKGVTERPQSMTKEGKDKPNVQGKVKKQEKAIKQSEEQIKRD